MSVKRVDKVTKAWIRNRSDELAVADGCWFDPEAGGYAVWWIERHCMLYEGEYAGQPLRLRGCHEDDLEMWEVTDQFDKQQARERAAHYIKRRAAGADCDWQYDCVMRIFGWQKRSKRWRRSVRRFRRGSIWVPKKNKKSPSIAAIGLYLMVGDNEPGQKVFFGAKDGAQARDIMGEHVRAMYEQSPDLKSECDLNLNKMRISHRPSRSFMQPMSSSNSRTMESKEGLNGSILIDETHVVDRAFIRRIKRAGISRAEPLQLEVSTAGTNPDGYGKEQFDYGAKVAAGERVNHSYFYAAYSAPQDTSDDDIKADPLKYGRMANPAWGHTISDEEFLEDFQASQVSELEWRDFKMYRLNIWQSVVTRWITEHDWLKCADSYTLEDLRNKTCTIGLDLSRTRDMTAAVLAFPEFGENGTLTVRLWPHFWLPRAYAEKHSNEAPFLEWWRAGHLQLTDGNEISTGEIYETFDRWRLQFNVAGVFYDPWGAVALTQMVEQGLNDSAGKELVASLGITRTPIGQNSPEMSLAIDDFEPMVRAGTIKHPQNPVLTWQFSHAGIKDVGGKTRLAKPERMAVKKIDGVVGSVMAVAGLKYCELTKLATAGVHSLYDDEPGSVDSHDPWDDDDEW